MTPETLSKIEDCAILQFTGDQIATIVDDSEVTAALTGRGKVSAEVKATVIRVVNRGWLRGEVDCRRAIKAEAEAGSTSAQKLLLELVWSRKNGEGDT